MVLPSPQVRLQGEKVHFNGCRRSLDQAEVDKSKVSEKLLDAQHEVLHLKSSLEVMLVKQLLNIFHETALCWWVGCRPPQLFCALACHIAYKMTVL